MAFGVKTNERPGTRATVKYARLSPSKARAVLNLVRGKSVAEARELLQFSDRGATDVVGKCLESAVANAENNDELPGDELFVSACYADEGPTLKRWRPRARGRATRIDKKTSHITVIVTRYDPDELAAQRERAGSRAGSGGGDAAARARRVARSRGEDPEAAAAAAASAAEADEVEADVSDADDVEASDADVVETVESEDGDETVETGDASAATDDEAEADADDEPEAHDDAERAAAPADEADASAADEEE